MVTGKQVRPGAVAQWLAACAQKLKGSGSSSVISDMER